MGRTLRAVGLVLALCACASRGPVPLVANGPRTVVFLVHGIGGNPSHFGHMQQALQHQLNLHAQGGRRYEVAFLNYDTASNTKDTHAFALEIAQAMHQRLQGHLRREDRISLVVHSQGGLVTGEWLHQALLGNAAVHPEYLTHVDAVVTLATPFWGAKMASFVTPLKDTPLVGDIMSPIPGLALPGHRQLMEMAFGSETIFSLRDTLVDFQQHPEKVAGLRHIRALTMGGYVKWIPASPFAAGTHEYEDDTAVMIPSARADFIYGRALGPGYADGEVLDEPAFSDVQVAPFQLVNAIHLSPSVDLPQLSRGIAQAQEDCVEDLECDHPSFKRVVMHLLGQPLPQDETHLQKMTLFILDVNVRLPPEDGPDTQVTLDFLDPPPGVHVARSAELYSAGKSYVVQRQGVQRFYFTGTSEHSYVPPPRREEVPAFEDRVVSFAVKAPGHKARVVHARVRATYSTFVDVQLERD